MKTNKIFFTLSAVLFSAGLYAQTADEIIDKHVTALGGMDKIKAVNTLVTERSMAIRGMDIPNKTILQVGKAIRSESTVMGNTMVQVVDGAKGWMIRPTMMGGTGEAEDMPAEVFKQQSSQLDPFGSLVNYKEKGNTVALVGKEKVDKKDTYHLKVTTKDGQPIDMFLDATTYLVSKVTMNMEGQPGEIELSDYKATDGILFPRSMDISSPQGTMSFITNKITVNSSVDDAIFKRPVK